MRYLLFIVLFLWPPVTIGQEMSSPSYTIELEQIEATSEPKFDTLTEPQLKKFTEEGFVVETPKVQMLQFSISDTIISLKNLREERIQTNSVLTTITSQGLFGYELLAIPLQGLESLNGDQIPPTQCDSGNNTCTTTSAKEWRSNNSFGWGYTVSGPDTSSDFKSNQYFRPFKTGESVVVSSHDAADSQRSAEITIKVTVNDEISEGNYSSIIKLIALPKL